MNLKRKFSLIGCSILGALAIFGFTMYQLNPPPKVPAVAPESAASSNRPYVVKLHAKWCPICMMTKGLWSELQSAYTGKVNLVVFDLTNKETVEASRAEAKRLGLERFFEEHGGETGGIFLLDGKSKEEKEGFYGSRQFAEYKRAIDGALATTKE